jgi:hypothetical protein
MTMPEVSAFRERRRRGVPQFRNVPGVARAACDSDLGILPGREQVVSKILRTTPYWKKPAWWWTDVCGAWPFSPEWLSAAFDVNAAPFMQSFVKVRVEPSQQRVRIIPYGVRGRLRWSDFDASKGVTRGDTAVEWLIPFSAQGKP